MGDIKSNQLKDIPFPDDFNDDDKEEYERLLNIAKVEHEGIYQTNRWIIHYGIIMYIRQQKGQAEPYSEEELKEIMKRYQLAEKEVVCKGDEIPYLYDKENNPIFKDNSYFFKTNEEGNIAESSAVDRVEIEIK